MDLYFTERFGVTAETLETYGAFDISIVSDLPLFVDPFLIFNSEKPEYQQLHESILEYLRFLRDKASPDLDPALIDNWYRFKEVKQNWLGFTMLGNDGSGLGRKFAVALHSSLGTILSDFGSEKITKSSHLEKLLLIKPGVGRDNISDFTTNLIKHYFLEYTQSFAKAHIDASLCSTFAVNRAKFNYTTESWQTSSYFLPKLGSDFVLLTPMDILTRLDTWINYPDMVRNFEQVAPSIPDDQLRAQVNHYFTGQLGKKPSAEDRQKAAASTILHHPEVIDYYIRFKEEAGDQAVVRSTQLVNDTDSVFVKQLRAAVSDIESRSTLYDQPWTSYEEALTRVLLFKDYVENQDGYKVINRNGQPFSRETEVQLFFGLIWCRTDFDVNREPNNGRGPVDFKVSYGSGDKSLIEFKLASNSSLKRNLENQVEVYEAANKTTKSIKAVICYTKADQVKVATVLKDLKLDADPSVVVIDARSDNKPSASKA